MRAQIAACAVARSLPIGYDRLAPEATKTAAGFLSEKAPAALVSEAAFQTIVAGIAG
jgi:hypothetical protein